VIFLVLRAVIAYLPHHDLKRLGSSSPCAGTGLKSSVLLQTNHLFCLRQHVHEMRCSVRSCRRSQPLRWQTAATVYMDMLAFDSLIS
jgi:hypothetical protein